MILFTKKRFILLKREVEIKGRRVLWRTMEAEVRVEPHPEEGRSIRRRTEVILAYLEEKKKRNKMSKNMMPLREKLFFVVVVVALLLHGLRFNS